MENSFQTSFIPKKPAIYDSSIPSVARKTTSISIVVTFLVMLIVVGATVGLFFYKKYLLENKQQLSLSILKIKDSFDREAISTLELYDKKVQASSEILSKHIVLSPLFSLIGDLTLSSIQYTKFNHSTEENGIFVVKISGVARDYKSIALQADVFNIPKGKMFKDVVFSNLVKEKNNTVTFDLEFIVDPSLLSYEKNIKNITEENVVDSSPIQQLPSNENISI